MTKHLAREVWIGRAAAIGGGVHSLLPTPDGGAYTHGISIHDLDVLNEGRQQAVNALEESRISNVVPRYIDKLRKKDQ